MSSTSPDFIPERKSHSHHQHCEKGKRPSWPMILSQRYYYLMVITADTRWGGCLVTSCIPSWNFRDLGGYKSAKQAKIPTEMLYRSPQIDSIPFCSRRDWKTWWHKDYCIISLRSEEERHISSFMMKTLTSYLSICNRKHGTHLQDIRDERENETDTIYRWRMNRQLNHQLPGIQRTVHTPARPPITRRHPPAFRQRTVRALFNTGAYPLWGVNEEAITLKTIITGIDISTSQSLQIRV